MIRRAFRAVVVVAASRPFILSVMIGALVLPACGPIEYVVNMPLGASGAIAQARTVKGEKFAPYESTAMLEYQHKSRELAGYARFHSSVVFARKAEENARKAKKLAQERAQLPAEQQEDLGVTVSESAPTRTVTVTTTPEGTTEIRAVTTDSAAHARPSDEAPAK